MKASELIKMLQNTIKTYGDLECKVDVDPDPWLTGYRSADYTCITTEDGEKFVEIILG